MNVGPTSEGLIPEPSIDRLKEVGKWMQVNGQAIYATGASPFKRLAWGRCTKQLHDGGVTLYLHVFNWPADGQLVVPGLKNTVEKAYLLADAGRQALGTQAGPAGLAVSVPSQAPDPICSVVVLRVQGELEISLPVPSQQP